MQEEAFPDAEHRASEMLCGRWPLAGRECAGALEAQIEERGAEGPMAQRCNHSR